MDESLLMEVKPQCMANPLYSVRVRAYALGQFRIQVMYQPMKYFDPEGEILQEMCTYERETMMKVIFYLANSAEPLEAAREYARPWNCENSGGRIRLDNTEKEGSVS